MCGEMIITVFVIYWFGTLEKIGHEKHFVNGGWIKGSKM
jgi:hypothetical protein